jgi:tetratricopeptide (TPR) repeat protein
MNAPEWTSGGGSRWHYLITQPFIWLHYFRLFFLPIGLNADTDWTTFAHWYDTRAFAGYAFVALLIVAIRRFRNEPPIAFGLAWFAIALLPTSSIFPLAEVANEHRVFFAFMGLVLAVVWWIHDRLPRNALIAGACAVLLAHAVGTQARNRIWKSEESLWTDVVAKSPGNGRAWMNFGLTQMARGQYTDAKASFERAAALAPTYSTLEINRGIVEGAIGDEAAAERHFKRALQLNADANAHFFYGRWLVQHGRGPEARVHFDEATRLSPAFADAQSLRDLLYTALGASNAGPHWPDYQSAFDAGLAEMRSNDWLDAACANRGALAHDPFSADAWNNLGWSLAQLGFRTEAAQAYEKALAIQPDHERARNNLALLIR